MKNNFLTIILSLGLLCHTQNKGSYNSFPSNVNVTYTYEKSFFDYIKDFSIIGSLLLGAYSAIKIYYLDKSFKSLESEVKQQQSHIKYLIQELNTDKNILTTEVQKLSELVCAITAGTAHKSMTTYHDLLDSQRATQEKLTHLVRQYNVILTEYEKNFKDLNVNAFTLMLSNLHNEQNNLHREIIKLEHHIDKISSKMDSKSLDERFARIEEIFQNGKIDKIYRELCSLRDKMNLLMR